MACSQPFFTKRVLKWDLRAAAGVSEKLKDFLCRYHGPGLAPNRCPYSPMEGSGLETVRRESGCDVASCEASRCPVEELAVDAHTMPNPRQFSLLSPYPTLRAPVDDDFSTIARVCDYPNQPITDRPGASQLNRFQGQLRSGLIGHARWFHLGPGRTPESSRIRQTKDTVGNAMESHRQTDDDEAQAVPFAPPFLLRDIIRR